MVYTIVSYVICRYVYLFFFFKQKTAYEMRISDWSSDVCSSDLAEHASGDLAEHRGAAERGPDQPRPVAQQTPPQAQGEQRIPAPVGPQDLLLYVGGAQAGAGTAVLCTQARDAARMAVPLHHRTHVAPPQRGHAAAQRADTVHDVPPAPPPQARQS